MSARSDAALRRALDTDELQRARMAARAPMAHAIRDIVEQALTCGVRAEAVGLLEALAVGLSDACDAGREITEESALDIRQLVFIASAPALTSPPSRVGRVVPRDAYYDALDAKAASHRVIPRDGYYEVVSGTSGRVYRVAPTGGESAVCDCAARTSRCSHVLSVIEYARALLSNQPTTAPPEVKPSQPSVQAHPSAPAAPAPSEPAGERSRDGGARDLPWIFERIEGEERAKAGR